MQYTSSKKNLFSEITNVPAILDQKIYPSLNGLRAIAVLMVVVYHFILLYGNQHLHGNYQSLIFIGPLGVNVFFVISGFLITTLCIKEKIITNDLSLKKFYLRRILRILPVAYLYILVIAILNYILGMHIAFSSFLSAIFFVKNISYFTKLKFDWDLAHYWSLSTEEQFYLLFPVFIKKKPALFVGILLFICFIVPLLFLLQYYIPGLNIGVFSSALRFLIKFQGIATGCLFSVLLFKGYLNFKRSAFMITLVSLFFIIYIKYDPFEGLRSSFSNLLVSIFIGLVIVCNIHPGNNFIYKFLNLKPLSFIGILSYSIYIWQQLFLSNDPKFPLSKYPFNLIWVAIVPCLSYFFFEKYFLKLKTKFHHKKPAVNQKTSDI